MKTKGEIEQELTEIGFNKVTIFRPGVLKADRVRYNFRYIELLFVLFVNLIDYVIPRKAIVHVDVVGRGKFLSFFFLLSFPFLSFYLFYMYYTLAMRKVATEEVEFEDYEITLADNGTLIETANHKKIHEIAS